ncbi:MAG: NOP58 family protein [Nanoarchaeota archaeon]|nr:NOP58 family protein [Nanoarchaeota archaeon]
MAHAICSNCIGTFVFLDKKIVEEKLFSKHEITKYCAQLEKQEQIEPEKASLKKYPGAEVLGKKTVPPAWALEFFSQEKYLKKMSDAIMLVTKRKVAASVHVDNLIIQASNNVDEIDKVANNLAKRLREWYELYNPEFSRSIESHEKFAELIQNKTREELLKEAGSSKEESMGADIDKKDLAPVMELAKGISALYSLRARQAEYIEDAMQKTMPNVNAICGSMIGAKLLSIAGSFEKLVMFPASTIQLLGAEKALFRHIKTGAKPPKFGVIINHPLVAKAKQADKGRAARMLADKISIAAKIDYFKGEFRGDQLRKQLEEKMDAISKLEKKKKPDMPEKLKRR